MPKTRIAAIIAKGFEREIRGWELRESSRPWRWLLEGDSSTQTAFAAGTLYVRPMKLLVGTHFFREREQNSTPAAPVDAAAIRKLAARITGHVITPDAPDDKSSCLVSNLAFDRYPAPIVRCADTSDVTRALDFGQSQCLPVAVRGGGHSAAGSGVVDGGVVIVLSATGHFRPTSITSWAQRSIRSLLGISMATEYRTWRPHSQTLPMKLQSCAGKATIGTGT